jgi:hypothetical protein
MPAGTRDQHTQVYNYIILALLEQTPEGAIPSALENDTCNSLAGILGLANNDIDDLRYNKTTGDNDAQTTVLTPLTKGEKGILQAVKSYVLYQKSIGISLREMDWIHDKKEDFDEYRVGASYIDLQNNTNATAAPMSLNRPRDPVADFKRGINRDPLQFPSLKDNKQWDLWNQDVKAQSRYQGVDDILDASYIPRTSTDITLFDEKQKFLYAVFLKTVLTDQCKALVRQYESTYGAQKVYAGLVTRASKSTKAAMDYTDLLSYITSVRLGDGAWKGTTHAFILHWENQLRKYEQMNPPTDHFSDGQKWTMLENTVGKVTELRAVKAQADQHKVHSGAKLLYGQYFNLLKSAAQAHDATFAARSKAPARKVYHSNMQPGNDDSFYDAEDTYDIDSDIQLLSANAHWHLLANNSQRLTRTQWRGLSKDGQTTWDTLTDDDKHKILEFHQPT